MSGVLLPLPVYILSCTQMYLLLCSGADTIALVGQSPLALCGCMKGEPWGFRVACKQMWFTAVGGSVFFCKAAD
jgi:hypothetical protein